MSDTDKVKKQKRNRVNVGPRTKIFSFCSKCHEMKYLTKHHIYPKSYYKNSPIFFLCRKCHDSLENLMPTTKMRKSFYVEILSAFITNDGIVVKM